MKVYSIFSDVARRFCPADKRPFQIDKEGVCFNRLLKEPPNEEQVLTCIRVLSRTVAAKTTGVYSYSLKHTIQRIEKRYVSNGACIEAARRLRLQMWVSADEECPNAMIGVRSRSTFRGALRVVILNANDDGVSLYDKLTGAQR